MFSSGRSLELPQQDILTWTFDHQDYDRDSPIWIDAYDSRSSITARDAKAYVRRMVAGLRKNGIQPGDTVCIHSFNNIWYPLIYLAIIGAGGRFVGSNPAYKPFELSRLFDLSKTKFLVVEPKLLPGIECVALQSGILAPNIFLLDFRGETASDSLPFRSWKVLFEHDEEDWECFASGSQSRSTPAALLWTSGTSGLPKAAVMSHAAILAQGLHAWYVTEHATYKVKRLISLPFFHSFVLPYHLTALRRGETTYVMNKFNPQDYADFIDRYSITTVVLVPTIALSVFASAMWKGHSFLSLREINWLTTDARFNQVWGMSEIGWMTAFEYPEYDSTGSVGRLLPECKARLVDEDGSEIHGECRQGEILVKSPGIMSGYLDNPEATAHSFLEGWFKTGDVAYCSGGKWYIVDRVKDMIKVRGWQVSPAEIEACLLTHHLIRDAAVVGVRMDGGLKEAPRAYVVVEPTTPPTVLSQLEIQLHVKERLASYKALDGGVVFVESIPRTPSGKIQKRILRELNRKMES